LKYQKCREYQMKQPFKTAREVSEYLLMRTGRAMQEDDFNAFQACFSFPLEIQTFQGQSIISNAPELKAVFDAVRTHYAKTGVTEVARHCIEAEFTDPHRVLATHETRLISRNVITQAPYPVMSVLQYDGQDWSVISSSYAIEDRADHNAALLCAEMRKSVDTNTA